MKSIASASKRVRKSASKTSRTRKPKTKSGPIVEIVDWEDHWTTATGGSWTVGGGLDHLPLIVHSAGIRVYEDKKVLQITTHSCEEKTGVVLTILKNCIVKRRTIQ